MNSYRVYNINEELMNDMTQFTNSNKNITIAGALFFFYEENIMKPLLKTLESNGYEIVNFQSIGSNNYKINAIDENNEEIPLFERSEKNGLLRVVSKEQLDKMLS